MFTHARSAAATGRGTEVNSRGFIFDGTTKAGTINLLTVEKGGSKKPVRVNVEVIVKDALTGAGASLVVQGVDEGGTVTTIATGTFGAGDTVRGSYLAYGRDKVQVVYAPGATAPGRGAVFAQLSGCGELVG